MTESSRPPAADPRGKMSKGMSCIGGKIFALDDISKNFEYIYIYIYMYLEPNIEHFQSISEYSIDVETILGGSESQYESIPVGNYVFVRDNYFWLIPIGFPFCGGCIVFAGWESAGNSAWLWNISNPPVQHSEKWMMWPVPTSLKRACTNWKATNVVNQYPLDVNCISSL